MDELLAEVTTGKRKGMSSDGAGGGMGCGKSGADHKINTKVSERQYYLCVGETAMDTMVFRTMTTRQQLDTIVNRSRFHSAASWQTG